MLWSVQDAPASWQAVDDGGQQRERRVAARCRRVADAACYRGGSREQSAGRVVRHSSGRTTPRGPRSWGASWSGSSRERPRGMRARSRRGPAPPMRAGGRFSSPGAETTTSTTCPRCPRPSCCTSATLLYLGDAEGSRSVALSTMRGWAAAIARVHMEAGFPSPTGDRAMTLFLRGLSRMAPERERQEPITALRIAALRAVPSENVVPESGHHVALQIPFARPMGAGLRRLLHCFGCGGMHVRLGADFSGGRF